MKKVLLLAIVLQTSLAWADEPALFNSSLIYACRLNTNGDRETGNQGSIFWIKLTADGQKQIVTGDAALPIGQDTFTDKHNLCTSHSIDLMGLNSHCYSYETGIPFSEKVQILSADMDYINLQVTSTNLQPSLLQSLGLKSSTESQKLNCQISGQSGSSVVKINGNLFYKKGNAFSVNDHGTYKQRLFSINDGHNVDLSYEELSAAALSGQANYVTAAYFAQYKDLRLTANSGEIECSHEFLEGNHNVIVTGNKFEFTWTNSYGLMKDSFILSGDGHYITADGTSVTNQGTIFPITFISPNTFVAKDVICHLK